jgi:small subunit ribosomal protein S12e
MVADGKVLGEWCGLARLKPDGTPAKLIGCSCAVIREWGVDSEARAVIMKHVESGASNVE